MRLLVCDSRTVCASSTNGIHQGLARASSETWMSPYTAARVPGRAHTQPKCISPFRNDSIHLFNSFYAFSENFVLTKRIRTERASYSMANFTFTLTIQHRRIASLHQLHTNMDIQIVLRREWVVCGASASWNTTWNNTICHRALSFDCSLPPVQYEFLFHVLDRSELCRWGMPSFIGYFATISDNAPPKRFQYFPF